MTFSTFYLDAFVNGGDAYFVYIQQMARWPFFSSYFSPFFRMMYDRTKNRI